VCHKKRAQFGAKRLGGPLSRTGTFGAMTAGLWAEKFWVILEAIVRLFVDEHETWPRDEHDSGVITQRDPDTVRGADVA
jgi:hypothetical protein